jgi:hypothetical protein
MSFLKVYISDSLSALVPSNFTGRNSVAFRAEFGPARLRSVSNCYCVNVLLTHNFKFSSHPKETLELNHAALK